MKDLGKIHQEIKKYYIESSLAFSTQESLKKSIQGIGVCILFFENSLENPYIIRDTRNFIYDLIDDTKHKDGKRLLKGLLKIVK